MINNILNSEYLLRLMSKWLLLFEIINLIMRYNIPNTLYSTYFNKCLKLIFINYYHTSGLILKIFGVINALIIFLGILFKNYIVLKISKNTLTIYFISYILQLSSLIFFNYFLKCDSFKGNYYLLRGILCILIIIILYIVLLSNIKNYIIENSNIKDNKNINLKENCDEDIFKEDNESEKQRLNKE